MISLLIPSRDRAMQADCLLRSIRDFFPLDIIDEIHFYYSSSGPEFEQGYELLKERNILDMIWYRSDIQKQRLDKFIDSCKSKYAGIVCDDCVFLRQFALTEDELNTVFDDRKVAAFSFRLGLNTTRVCQLSNEKQERVAELEQFGRFIKWDWKQSTQHYRHPFALEGNIHRTPDLVNITKTVHAERFLQWECWANDAYRKIGIRNKIAGFTNSVMFNTPLNDAEGWNERTGKFHPVSRDELNKRYLAGEIISRSSFPTQVDCCQYEVPLIFERV